MENVAVTPSGYNFDAVHAAMRRYVDTELLAGVSSAVLVGRELVDLNCVGWADKEQNIALRVDHLFRVFSNTKLITSCAALLLFEEGRFQLDDPIEQFIPQLANRRVLRPGAITLDDTEPASRPITIRHLMSHSAGLSYGLLDPGTIIFQAYNKHRVLNPATPLSDMMDTLAFPQALRWRRTDLDLAGHAGASAQPAARWTYAAEIRYHCTDDDQSIAGWHEYPFSRDRRDSGKAFGLAGALTLTPLPVDPKNSTGEFQWGGIAGKHWWISPQANLAGLLMTQRHMAFWHPFSFEFKQLVYQAVRYRVRR